MAVLLLIYDQGGVFVAHRDTEKAEGMFGTLVIALPSTHRGGELVIRHAGREAVVNLRSEEVSELTFAAFYADCEHEVRPITEGHRVCLIYNLLLAPDGKRQPVPTAPQYGPEVKAAAKLLEKAFAEVGAPAKLAWLLQHEYSPAGLSFAGLKGEDAALVQVLREAAEKAGCAVHLGIVHIEESGAAEPEYESYRSSRWSRYREEDEEVSTGGDFEVIEVSDSRHYVDQWRDPDDRPVQYGELPLEEGEVLPAGAMDDEEPDAQRMTEATGNEGASFERSYHRAALVLWPRDRFADVLMQSGVGAVLPLLRDRVRQCAQASSPESARLSVIRLAGRMVDGWGTTPTYRNYGDPVKQADRSQMIRLLGEIGEPALLGRFVGEVVTRLYDGSENEALVAQIGVLGAGRARVAGRSGGGEHAGLSPGLREPLAAPGGCRTEACTGMGRRCSKSWKGCRPGIAPGGAGRRRLTRGAMVACPPSQARRRRHARRSHGNPGAPGRSGHST